MEMSAIAAHLYAMAPAITVTKITLAMSPRVKNITDTCVASPTVTFTAYAGTKLYCLITEAHARERLAQGDCMKSR